MKKETCIKKQGKNELLGSYFNFPQAQKSSLDSN